jgi:hypothetical protein
MQGESDLHETHDYGDALAASALAAQAPCMEARRHGGHAPHDERRRRRRVARRCWPPDLRRMRDQMY